MDSIISASKEIDLILGVKSKEIDLILRVKRYNKTYN